LLSQEEIEALKNGDQQAYTALVALFSRKVYNLCLSLLHNQEDGAYMAVTTIFLNNTRISHP
jgi:DNA-directed RNA polymerase specialized sigma24 family protein